MNSKTKERAKTIANELGKERSEKIAAYILKHSNNRSSASLLQALKDEFKLDQEQAGACWYAWQTYHL